MPFTSIVGLFLAVLVSHDSCAQQKQSAAVACYVKAAETSALHRYTPEDIVGVAAFSRRES